MNSHCPLPRRFASHRAAVALLALFVVVPDSTRAEDADSRARLAAMPRDQRERLAAKLHEFDGLDRATQDAIRSLDERLAKLPPAERANYQSVLRRYHLWLEGLPETQRNELRALPPDQRMAAVNRLLAEPNSAPQRSGAMMVLRVAEFGDFSPYELADHVKVWQALTPAERTEVSRLNEPLRTRKLQTLGRDHSITPTPRPTRLNEEALFDRALKNGFPPLWNLRKKDELPTKGDMIKAARIRGRMLEQLALLETPPARVTPENLSRFVAALPPWIRVIYDPLPPDEARRRLTVLYRLIYPAPAEFVEPKPATAKPATGGMPAQAPATATPKPGANPGTGTNPF